MSADRELLERISAALAHGPDDARALVDEARQSARDEVLDLLRRAFRHRLLAQVADHLDGGTGMAAPVDRPAVDPVAAADSPAAPVTYLFGVSRAPVSVDDDLPVLPGGGPVRSVHHDHLRAVVCDADVATLRSLEELGPDDLDRLAAVANVHDEVLARVAAQAPVLPLRLGTAVTDDAVVRDLLTANAAALTAELERLEGHAEWAVVARVTDGRAPEDARPHSGSGSDYLRGRQAALAERANRWEAHQHLADDVHARLSAFAVASDTVDRRPLEQVPPVLHGVYLLAWEQIEAFESAVEQARAAYPDAIIEATGPWPPYHFTSVALSLEGRTIA